MHDVSGEMTALQEPLSAIRVLLDDGRDDSEQTDAAIGQLRDIAASAEDAARVDLARFANQLASLAEIAALSLGDEQFGSESDDIFQFVIDSLPLMQSALEDAEDVGYAINQRIDEAQHHWGECLQLVMDGEGEVDAWQQHGDEPDDAEPLAEGASGEEIGMILTSLAQAATAPSNAGGHEAARAEIASATFQQHTADDSAQQDDAHEDVDPLDEQIVLDHEIREAYLDDAQRCLASIENSLLAFEGAPANPQPLRQVCRELHTLKGASASVGLVKLAGFLHKVEDELQASCDQTDGAADVDPILQCVDLVRQQIDLLTSNKPPEAKPIAASSKLPAPRQDRFVDSSSATKDSVRVKSAQLDRLMDMLAELVMLRNRRESRVEQLKEINGELVHCVSRLRACDEGGSATAALNVGSDHGENRSRRSQRQQVSSLTEIANDLLELGRNLRELYEPIGDENRAISRFIRQFRQELMQLRRVPMSGLFTRLQRAARDAAKSEHKKVTLKLVGQDVGLERAVQEQLYDALLHIVRNAVSHGIESESQRVAQGKNPAGIVTLEATGGSNLLVITVRDDGRGLDYDALRRRGVEMGLISVDRAATRSELARLIFHAGFSTKTETSELSGRGIGMDVVASTLDQLHSWIEIDSVPGEGTSIRLLIPLHSVIEHAMVFRSAGQEYAVPTQFVKAAGRWSQDDCDFPIVPFANLCPGIRSDEVTQPQLIVIAHGWKASDKEADSADPSRRTERRIGLLVDEIVGPEEVVVRPLPGLMKDQRLFAGVTLSGTGDIMLLFDSQHLLERGLAASRDGLLHRNSMPITRGSTQASPKRALVVDDSRSSRRALMQLLDQDEYTIDEAADGAEALKLLNQQSYDIIFTDLEMPQMSGFDLLREIRSRESTAKTPVLIVSSRDEEMFQQKAKKLGVTDYLTKPVSEKTMKGALHRCQELNRGNN